MRVPPVVRAFLEARATVKTLLILSLASVLALGKVISMAWLKQTIPWWWALVSLAVTLLLASLYLIASEMRIATNQKQLKQIDAARRALEFRNN